MRITGGRLRGSKLPHGVPKGVRPTSSRVREALFSIVGQDLQGWSVLDAFGGSGMLALEAWSRGAAPVVVVERSRRCSQQLRRAADALGAELRVIVGASPDAAPHDLFDLVLADPPYDSDLTSLLPGLAERVGSRLVVEHRHGDPLPEMPGLVLEQTRRYGDTGLTFYRPSRGSGR